LFLLAWTFTHLFLAYVICVSVQLNNSILQDNVYEHNNEDMDEAMEDEDVNMGGLEEV